MDKYNVEFFPQFLNNKESSELYRQLLPQVVLYKNKRSTVIFADEGIKYTIEYFGQTSVKETVKWIDPLMKVKNKLETYTKEKYNVCVLQCYPNGNVGINPHRDKEMVKGTTIAGVSLGETRVLELQRGMEKKEYRLNSGSLYLLNPPTNSYWTHSIRKDATKRIRLSLTFRNYV